jgi:SAM-dependent methyltransferase
MYHSYGDPDYWEERYKNNQSALFDWLEDYRTLKPLFESKFSKEQKILNVGCGNAVITMDMYDDGYHNIVNMDISKVVIEQMMKLNEERPLMTWEHGDVLNMSYPDETFDVILDKSNPIISRHPRCYSLWQRLLPECCDHDERGPAGSKDRGNIPGSVLRPSVQPIGPLRSSI